MEDGRLRRMYKRRLFRERSCFEADQPQYPHAGLTRCFQCGPLNAGSVSSPGRFLLCKVTSCAALSGSYTRPSSQATCAEFNPCVVSSWIRTARDQWSLWLACCSRRARIPAGASYSFHDKYPVIVTPIQNAAREQSGPQRMVSVYYTHL